MMLPSTSATLSDCQQFVDAIEQAGGDVPTTLTNLFPDTTCSPARGQHRTQDEPS